MFVLFCVAANADQSFTCPASIVCTAADPCFAKKHIAQFTINQDQNTYPALAIPGIYIFQWATAQAAKQNNTLYSPGIVTCQYSNSDYPQFMMSISTDIWNYAKTGDDTRWWVDTQRNQAQCNSGTPDSSKCPIIGLARS